MKCRDKRYVFPDTHPWWFRRSSPGVFYISCKILRKYDLVVVVPPMNIKRRAALLPLRPPPKPVCARCPGRTRSYGIAPLSVCVSLITDDVSLRLFIDWPESCETAGFSVGRAVEKWNGRESRLRETRRDYLLPSSGQKSRRRGQNSKFLGEAPGECITIDSTSSDICDVSKAMVFSFK